MSLRRFAALLPLLLAAGPAASQTPDPVFTLWTWNPAVRGPRITGLAGAFVTTAEGSLATLLSPACLSFTDAREISLSAGTQPGLGFVQRVGERIVVSARIGRTLERTIAATGVDVNESGTIDSGRVDFSAWTLTVGAALERRWGREDRNGISVGLSLGESKLSLEGTYSVYRPETRTEDRVALADGSAGARLQGTLAASVVYERGHRYTDRGLRLGAAVRGVPLWPSAWEPERSAIRLVDGAIAAHADAAPFVFREPKTFSAGLEGRLARFLLVGQVDWTDYDDVLRSLQRNAPATGPFTLDNSGVDWSAALEVRLTDLLSARGGYRREQPHRFRMGSGAAASDVDVLTLGATLRQDVLGKVVHIDIDWWRGLTFTDFTIGAALEF
jgi:hypothetical protein